MAPYAPAFRNTSTPSSTWLAAPAIALMVAACTGQPLLETPVVPMAANANETAKAGSATKTASAELVSKAQANPKDVLTVIKAARALRAEGERARALALLEKASIAEPQHPGLIRETGLLSLELGHIGKARALLAKSVEHNPTDWQSRSALGAALASGGKHQEAQKHFAKALELAPDHPSILNNLALSYALDGKPAQAERILRIAVAVTGSRPHVRQNLALVLGAGGKLAEAQKLAQGTPAANTAYLAVLAERAAAADAKPADSARGKELPAPYGLGARPRQ